jgi:hypothetical protein
LRDLFTDVLLSDDSKLTPFSKNARLQGWSQKKQPLNIQGDAALQTELLSAYFEHHLKELYTEFINGILKPMTHDDLEFCRKFALNTLQGCLEKKPEQEDVILEIIVNKLGDQNKRV